MAHVQIPAKEDVAQFPFHHAAPVKMPSISLTGEGCEVERVTDNAFHIRVVQQAEKSLEAITDFGPLWEAIRELEERVKGASEWCEIENASAISRDSFLEERLDRIAAHVSTIEAKQNVMTANLFAARDLARYALAGAALSTTLSVATGIALWILKH